MAISEMHQECKDILASADLSPVERMKAVDQIIREALVVKGPIAWREGDAVANPTTPYGTSDKSEMLTDLANEFRSMVRLSAWGSENPITFKEAVGQEDLFDEETWDLIETWIDHDRDYKWNYINIVQFNLKNNKKADGKDFWLSPQHFRMAAIVDTCAREIDADGGGFDLDLAKAMYKNPNQIPNAISSSIATLRHTA